MVDSGDSECGCEAYPLPSEKEMQFDKRITALRFALDAIGQGGGAQAYVAYARIFEDYLFDWWESDDQSA